MSDQVTIHQCPPKCNKGEHVFDGPEVPVCNDPERPGYTGGMTSTCSKCGARAIDVHLFELP
jgi:hypothetical protein